MASLWGLDTANKISCNSNCFKRSMPPKQNVNIRYWISLFSDAVIDRFYCISLVGDIVKTLVASKKFTRLKIWRIIDEPITTNSSQIYFSLFYCLVYVITQFPTLWSVCFHSLPIIWSDWYKDRMTRRYIDKYMVVCRCCYMLGPLQEHETYLQLYQFATKQQHFFRLQIPHLNLFWCWFQDTWIFV